jgi:hypothetical protein
MMVSRLDGFFHRGDDGSSMKALLKSALIDRSGYVLALGVSLLLSSCATLESSRELPAARHTLDELTGYVTEVTAPQPHGITAIQQMLARFPDNDRMVSFLGDVITCQSRCAYQDVALELVLEHGHPVLTARAAQALESLRADVRASAQPDPDTMRTYRVMMTRFLQAGQADGAGPGGYGGRFLEMFVEDSLTSGGYAGTHQLFWTNAEIFAGAATGASARTVPDATTGTVEGSTTFAMRLTGHPRWQEVLSTFAARYPFPYSTQPYCHPVSAFVGSVLRGHQERIARARDGVGQNDRLAQLVQFRTRAMPMLMGLYAEKENLFHQTANGQDCFNQYANTIADSLDPDLLTDSRRSGVTFQSGDGHQIAGKRIGWMHRHAVPGSDLANLTDDMMSRFRVDPMPLRSGWYAQEVRRLSGPENRDRFEVNDRQYVIREAESSNGNTTVLLNASHAGISCHGPGQIYAGFVEDVSTGLFVVEEKGAARGPGNPARRWRLEQPMVFEYMFCGEATPSVLR